MTVKRPEDGQVQQQSRQLKRGTIGVPGMLFMVVAATAPLTALASNFALSIVAGAGAGTLAWIVVVGALLFVFTAGYVVMSRHVVNAAAYFAFLGYGLGRVVGAATAFIAAIAYNMATVAMLAAAGYFGQLAVSSYLDIDIDWYWFTFVALLLVWAAGYFGVSIASRVAIVVCAVQFAIVGALTVAILVQSTSSFTLDGLAPSSMFSGNFALTLVFCMLSFASYEAAATYGEECNAPGDSIRRATYLALSLLVSLFLVASWSLIAAVDDKAAAAASDPGALVTVAADQYLGQWAGTLIAFCVALSFLAAAVAFHNMAARYHFSLSRAGLIYERISRMRSRSGIPANATHLQIMLSVLVIVPFVIAGLDPLLNLFPAVSAVTSLSTVYVMCGCCLSVIVSSVKGTVTGSFWSTRIAPTISGIGIGAIGVLIVANYQDVTGSASPYIAAMPLIPIVGAAYGAWAMRRNSELELENYLTE